MANLHNNKYDPDYCDLLIEMGKDGKGIVEFCSRVGVSKQTAYNWEKSHPDFAAARELHWTHLQAWWERAGREGMFTQGFNSQVWTKNMHNRFRGDWDERVAVEHGGGVTITKITRTVVDPKA